MDQKQVRHYCLDKPGTTAEFPFGPEAEVFKVAGKMFALVMKDSVPLRMNLKCDPVRAEMLRQTYDAVQPGYHMNKQHWNTVIDDGTVPEDEILDLIDHSYDLVVQGLARAARARLQRG